jgi:hypothetical protein
VSAELLAWLAFIAALYIAAFAVLQLEKHWHRTAQVIFSLATLFFLASLVLWVWNSPDGLRGGLAFIVAIFAIGTTIWFVRKVDRGLKDDKLAKETNAFLIGRLNDFVKEAQQIESKPWLEQWGEMFSFRGRVEHFLSLHLSDEHVEQFKARRTYALEEMIKELIDGAATPALREPQAGFEIEIVKIIASPLNGPDWIVVGSQLFVHLHIVRIGTSSTIRAFGIDIATGKASYTVERAEGGKLYYPLGFGGNGQEILNLHTLVNSDNFQPGQGREGYLTFYLEDTNDPSELSKTIPKYLKSATAKVWIKDALGGKHYSKGVEIKTFERE